jgi:hypothetical protein
MATRGRWSEVPSLVFLLNGRGRPLGVATLSARKRWLISQFVDGEMSGTCWEIGQRDRRLHEGGWVLAGAGRRGDRSRPHGPGQLQHAEKAVLDHGYLGAEATAGRHLPTLLTPGALLCAMPNPDWMDGGQSQGARWAAPSASSYWVGGETPAGLDSRSGPPKAVLSLATSSSRLSMR